MEHLDSEHVMSQWRECKRPRAVPHAHDSRRAVSNGGFCKGSGNPGQEGHLTMGYGGAGSPVSPATVPGARGMMQFV